MPLLIRLSEYMSIMIPSSLKIHQSRGQLRSGAWSLLKVHVQIFPVLPQPHINILAGQNTNLGTWASACLTHENQTSEPLAPQRCPGSLWSWWGAAEEGSLLGTGNARSWKFWKFPWKRGHTALLLHLPALLHSLCSSLLRTTAMMQHWHCPQVFAFKDSFRLYVFYIL